LKHILLLRHAKSSWDDPSLSDHARPLAPRGRKAAARMAEHLRSEPPVDLVLCSPALRTRQTLELMASAFGDAEVAIEGDLYGATDDELLGRLRSLTEDVSSVALIGHNPGVHDLAVSLTRQGRRLERYPTGALAVIQAEGTWADLAPGRGRLVSFVTPKELA
jgi:phosphohistidine phosphatase